ncbi:MAG: DNA internalization-related competence protein ComEC/Rec2 [bacterium]|nr:DNA internalization-related competence protein ComEC/Rec2 [Gammaproteobacteria bacterium]HIL95087.1 DNA internalization-related competence protein ComEC/Rec2 [Pseudomonadales bacterium]
MYHATIAFVLATMAVVLLPILPDVRFLAILLSICGLGLMFPRLRLLCGFVLGITFSLNAAHHAEQNRLSVELQGENILIEGYVRSLPQIRTGSVKFIFQIVDSRAKNAKLAPCLISLSWYSRGSARLPRPGEKWRLLVRLVRPHGSINTGLFNYEGWLLANGISATGYVREDVRNRLITTAGFNSLHHQVRRKLRHIIKTRLPDDSIRGVLLALMIGESAQISKSVWQTLSDTGTNHLMIISGLHIGLVAGIVLGLCRILIRPITRYWQPLAGLSALGLTFIYGSIAGLGLPVQRALVMVAIGLLGLLVRRNIPVWLMFMYALLAVTVINPFASLGAGYWLSFGAVASLIFVFSGRREGADGLIEKLRALIKTQWVVFVAMAPLLICWVMQVSLVAFIVNLIAIPIVGICIVPTLLLCLPLLLIGIEPGFVLLELAYQLLGWFIESLRWVADFDLVFRKPSTNLLFVALASLGSLILLLPKGLVPRWPGLVLLLPLITTLESTVPPGEVVVNVLDVGQGLSVVIKTRQHVVVYDAGPAFGAGFDAGEQIVAPSVRLQGSNEIHTLVVSHSDIDHAGGVRGLERQLTVRQKITGHTTGSTLGCRLGQDWQLDQVRFSILLGNLEASDNNQSCVLLVEANDFAMLLPGDIEAFSEEILTQLELPFIDIMVAPHHGSLSSSTPAFLNHVNPSLIIVSAGYLNRFQHPHPRVLARYQARDIGILNTATSGAITVTTAGGLKIESARSKYRRFWFDKFPGQNIGEL